MNLYLSTCDYIFLAGTYRLSRMCKFFRKTSSIGFNSVSAPRNKTFGIVLGMVFFLGANLHDFFGGVNPMCLAKS